MSMELENEARVSFSPGARVVVGSPLLPLLGAAALGFAMGLAIARLTWRGRRDGWWRGRPFAAKEPGRPFRMPGENPDVETEL